MKGNKMKTTRLGEWATVFGAALALSAGTALADTMHPELGAKLSGMGQHGIVNLRLQVAKGKLCWTFELTTKGITGASIRDAAGMIEAKPGSYRVWIDTKGHPGELRGKLFAGMAHM